MSETQTPARDFAATVEQLETLVERLESGALSLEDSLAAFEQGVGLARQAQTRLDDAELKVRSLGEDGAGGLAVTPFTAPESPPGSDSNTEDTPPW